jgi:hypothetical protein
LGCESRLETASSHGVPIADEVEVATDGEMLDANQFADVIEMFEGVFYRDRLKVAHHEADEVYTHDPAQSWPSAEWHRPSLPA